MFAIAFDLVVADTLTHHPKGVTQAYGDIRVALERRGFAWQQGSVYVTEPEDLANLFLAIQDLKALVWFPLAVRDIRAFRIEQWSDFTAVVKSRGSGSTQAALDNARHSHSQTLVLTYNDPDQIMHHARFPKPFRTRNPGASHRCRGGGRPDLRRFRRAPA